MTKRQLIESISNIRGVDREVMRAARQRQESLAKPPGSLGQLEEIAVRMAGITGRVIPEEPERERNCVIVFCADNGVVAQGVASAPQSVTRAQTMNFCRRLTGVGTLAKSFNSELLIVDMGVKDPIPEELYDEIPLRDTHKIVDRRIRPGTWDIAEGPAMTEAEMLRAMSAGVEMVQAAASAGFRVLGIGEMGIGNTTTSAAVLSAITGAPAEVTCGRGGGVNDTGFRRKKEIVEQIRQELCEEWSDVRRELCKEWSDVRRADAEDADNGMQCENAAATSHDADNEMQRENAAGTSHDVDNETQRENAAATSHDADNEMQRENAAETSHDADNGMQRENAVGTSHDVDNETQRENAVGTSHDVDSETQRENAVGTSHDVDSETQPDGRRMQPDGGEIGESDNATCGTSRDADQLNRITRILARGGGFDLAAMTGAYLGAAMCRLPVVIDGYISVVAAVAAAEICPAAADYMIASHQSAEPGYLLAIQRLEQYSPSIHPFLGLDMRLGEGSGCPIAFEVIRGACAVMRNMATFEEASINDDYLEEVRAGGCF